MDCSQVESRQVDLSHMESGHVDGWRMRPGMRPGLLALGLATLVLPSGTSADTARGTMRVGLTIVAPATQPAIDDSRAAPGATGEVHCASHDLRYHECRPPFAGPASLARLTSDVICIEGGNWGWRGDLVWVDRGCSGVFVSRSAAKAVAARG